MSSLSGPGLLDLLHPCFGYLQPLNSQSPFLFSFELGEGPGLLPLLTFVTFAIFVTFVTFATFATFVHGCGYGRALQIAVTKRAIQQL